MLTTLFIVTVFYGVGLYMLVRSGILATNPDPTFLASIIPLPALLFGLYTATQLYMYGVCPNWLSSSTSPSVLQKAVVTTIDARTLDTYFAYLIFSLFFLPIVSGVYMLMSWFVIGLTSLATYGFFFVVLKPITLLLQLVNPKFKWVNVWKFFKNKAKASIAFYIKWRPL